MMYRCSMPAMRRTVVTGLVLLLAALVVPLWVGLLRTSTFAIATPVQLFGNLLGNNLIFILAAPIFPVLVVGPQLSEELSRRFMSLTRTRESIAGRLGRVLGWNAAAGAIVMFVIVVVTAVVSFCVAPQLGWVHLDPTVYSLSSLKDIADSETSQFAFSQLVAGGHWLYALVYALWVGALGGCYATLGLSLMVMLPNRFVGISLPWLGYIVLSFGLGVLGFPGLAPTAIAPFNLTQVPMWQPLTMSLIVAAAAAFAAVRMLRGRTRWESLQ